MAYYPPSYDDYYVETYEDLGKPFRERGQLEEQHRKREKQLAIAEELSQLASEEYRDDIVSHMETMEVRLTGSSNEPICANDSAARNLPRCCFD